MVLELSVQQEAKSLVNQGRLGELLRKLFAGKNIQENVRKQSAITNPHTGHPLEIDIWIPDLNLCFEFQDPHHYAPVWQNHLSLEQIQRKDNVKREALLARRETLYLIPCWWDGKKSSLIGTIRFQRPDLLQEHVGDYEAIPLNYSLDFFEYYSIPEVGDLMLASLPVSSHFAKTLSPDAPWWLGEKYDGVRFCWNAKSSTLYLRTGIPVDLPEKITRLFPVLYLDGEIWFGKGFYSESRSILSDDHHQVDWPMLKFVVFDEMKYKHYPFEDRYKRVLETPSQHSFVVNASRRLCTSKKQLSRAMKAVLRDGGEGLILRKPKSGYESGRSPNLVKLKAYKGDREALVITEGFEEDSDFLSLLLPEGTVIRARKTNTQYNTAPQPGDVVTFAFSNFSPRALPTRPFIQRVRTDLNWEQVLKEHFVPGPTPKSLNLNAHTQKAFGLAPVPHRYWTSKAGNNVKRFFIRFARSKGFDHLVPENWYSVTMNDVRKFKGGLSELSHFRSIVPTLIAIFPNIGLEPGKFASLPRNYWQDKRNRKQFLDHFALEHGFDPLKPDNWYSIKISHISTRAGGSSFLGLYNNSIRSAVISLFPNLNFDISKFGKSREDILADERLKKKFIKLANSLEFDPLVAENWHSARLNLELMQKSKVWATVTRRYKGSFPKALLHLFPDIGLDEQKLRNIQDNYTAETKHMRTAFDAFAERNDFDPLNPHHWYAVPKENFIQIEGAGQFLKLFENPGEAIACLYPEIELDKRKFHEKTRGFFDDTKNRRKFFDKFAQDRGFDPLIARNWYSISTQEVYQQKHGYTVMQRRYSSLYEALKDIYPEIGLQMKFHKSPVRYWNDDKNVRAFFDQFASENGFDPSNAENWYKVKMDDIHKTKDGLAATANFAHSPFRSLSIAYPEIGLDPSRFLHSPSKYWAAPENRKRFFDEFSEVNRFDPLVAQNWYKYNTTDFMKRKHGYSVLSYYGNSYIQALLQVYPNIGLETWKFSKIPHGFYNDLEHRKQFFVRIAKEANFDPLLADYWHTFRFPNSIYANKVARIVLSYYADTCEALVSVFPNIGLQREKFAHIKILHKAKKQ
eukprot:Phypoly_transcript_01480.p1 GENE.Phypoly_transcript_01480~~Phypoly_transcript_01480.p1  ORF type:complete len:1080 (+),score=145.14 Phypoly_transcript_01480:111-3350(+)